MMSNLVKKFTNYFIHNIYFLTPIIIWTLLFFNSNLIFTFTPISEYQNMSFENCLRSSAEAGINSCSNSAVIEILCFIFIFSLILIFLINFLLSKLFKVSIKEAIFKTIVGLIIPIINLIIFFMVHTALGRKDLQTIQEIEQQSIQMLPFQLISGIIPWLILILSTISEKPRDS